jgi:CxxC motif-containing protein (DUF1111 family)
MWHHGEGDKAKENYANLTRQDREAILKFLGSL